jgi:hypothetical protein
MHTNLRLQAATIFSRVSAPPPRAAAALDEVQVMVGLVGAVDIHRQAVHRVQVQHRDAV